MVKKKDLEKILSSPWTEFNEGVSNLPLKDLETMLDMELRKPDKEQRVSWVKRLVQRVNRERNRELTNSVMEDRNQNDSR